MAQLRKHINVSFGVILLFSCIYAPTPEHLRNDQVCKKPQCLCKGESAGVPNQEASCVDKEVCKVRIVRKTMVPTIVKTEAWCESSLATQLDRDRRLEKRLIAQRSTSILSAVRDRSLEESAPSRLVL